MAKPKPAKKSAKPSLAKSPKESFTETVAESPKIIEVKPSEPKLYCRVCGGELILLRDVSNQREWKCSKCHRGMCEC